MSDLHQLIHRQRPGPWQKFLAQPLVYLSQMLYHWHKPILAKPLKNAIEIICISDTHNAQPPIPTGDILIHAGDLTQSGTFAELQNALNWLRTLPHPTKIVIAGNHDLLLDSYHDDPAGQAASQRSSLEWGDIIYLENNQVSISCPSKNGNDRRLRIYGSPYSARHGNWAFQYAREEDVWTDSVPDGIDVLVTHGPPFGHLDLLQWGCRDLLRTLWRVRPKLHIFGHVHEGAGMELLSFDGLQRAYEQSVAEGGGLRNFWRIGWELGKSFLRSRVETRSILVNASVVGGLRDDERRRAVRVWI